MLYIYFEIANVRGVMGYTFNPSTVEAQTESGESLSRPSWSTQQVSSHPELNSEPCSKKQTHFEAHVSCTFIIQETFSLFL